MGDGGGGGGGGVKELAVTSRALVLDHIVEELPHH